MLIQDLLKTDSGYPLYEKMGFEKLDRDMVLTL